MCRPSLLLSLERQSDIPRGYRQLEFPRGSTGVSRSWNCHPPKIAPHPWNFLTPCFAISKIFPPLRRSRTEEMPFPPEKLDERSTMGKVFSLSLEPFVLEHVRFVFLEERAFQADPAVWAPPFWKLDTNIRFVEYYLGENGVQDFYTTIFNGFFVYLFHLPDFDVLIKFRHRNTGWISAKSRFADKRLFTITTTVFGF